MVLKDIIKKNEGKYLTCYELVYEGGTNSTKVYEMVSRNNNIRSVEELSNTDAEAVVMILHDSTKEKILLCKEFRMALGKYIYSFPSGLIEQGETVFECANRELKEETGLHLHSIEIQLPESFSAVGLCNEKSICIIGEACGIIGNNTNEFENIYAHWFTKEEVKHILQYESVSARMQMYCYMWIYRL